MKTFLAIYLGSTSDRVMAEWEAQKPEVKKEKEEAGVKAWSAWATENSASIVDNGFPLGKTKRINPQGVSDAKNSMGAYTVVRTETHEDAAKLFLNHPHFTIFPGVAVEVMECVPMPSI